MFVNIVYFCPRQHPQSAHIANFTNLHPHFSPHIIHVCVECMILILHPLGISKNSSYVKMTEFPALLFHPQMNHYNKALFMVFHKDQTLVFCVQFECTISHDVVVGAHIRWQHVQVPCSALARDSAGSMLCFSVAPVKSLSTSTFFAPTLSCSQEPNTHW